MTKSKPSIQILCVSMYQSDFSLVKKMNVKCDMIIANQTDHNIVKEKEYDWGKVQLISTTTRGVGKNRNTAFLYASGDILLLSDDDMIYDDDYIGSIQDEFLQYPEADIIIFNISTNDEHRKQKQNKETKKTNSFSRLPYGGPRIAIRKNSWEKSNIWFTTLFGGGAKYSNGEDSYFLMEARKHSLSIFVSNKHIGTVDMENSSWFAGTNKEFFFNKGAFCAALHKYMFYVYAIYFCFRVKSEMRLIDRFTWFCKGKNGYNTNRSFGEL